MFYGNFASRSPNVGMHDWGNSFAVVPSGRRHRAVRLLQFTPCLNGFSKRNRISYMVQVVVMPETLKQVNMHRPRILIETAWFPPFGLATTEISSNSIENISF